ncbi:TetR/AcrR family transcriptional regulator [Rhodococcus sp. MEB064]|uniref:TetR/AcrR family transcriptional regulator n=1 Tax=Rhodococcus sp. MEB064 TaxID=1587522 RepID=UPI0006964800|nr:TetR/AcrR family transcriptional regulator [Rhodococcus sp. MEB064]
MTEKALRTVDSGARGKILTAAFEIASQRGYDGTTIALIAKRAGVKVGSIYWQFASKDQIIAEVIAVSYDEWRLDWNSAGEEWTSVKGELASCDAVRRMRWGVDRMVYQIRHGLLETPAFWTLSLMLIMDQRSIETTARRRIRQIRVDAHTELVRQLAELLPTPGDRPLLEASLARIIMAWCDGLVIAKHFDDSFDSERSLRLLARGIGEVVESAVL